MTGKPAAKRYNLSQALLGLGEDQLKRKGSQRGTVRMRGGKWYIDFREFVVDDAGNVKWRKTCKAIDETPGEKRLTKRQAEDKGYRDHVSKANGLTITPGASSTVEQFVNVKWQPDYIDGQSKSTRMLIKTLLKCHILPSLGHCQLREVSRAMVQTLITGKARSGLSTSTVCHIRNYIGMIFAHARRLNFFAGELPTSDLLIDTVEHKAVRPLTFDDVALVKEHLDERMSALVDLLAHLGLRISEAAGLRWCCVNLGDETQWVDGFGIPPLSIYVREQYYRNEWKRLKTDGSKAVVPLTSDVWVPLSEWFLRSKHTGPMDTVFAGRNGRPFDAHNTAARKLKPAAVKAGLPFVSWHSFRHTTATRSDQALTMREKMDLLRHKSVGVHMSYTASNIDTIRQKLELMNTPKTRH